MALFVIKIIIYKVAFKRVFISKAVKLIVVLYTGNSIFYSRIRYAFTQHNVIILRRTKSNFPSFCVAIISSWFLSVKRNTRHKQHSFILFLNRSINSVGI